MATTKTDYSKMSDTDIVNLVCDFVLAGKKVPQSLNKEIERRKLA